MAEKTRVYFQCDKCFKPIEHINNPEGSIDLGSSTGRYHFHIECLLELPALALIMLGDKIEATHRFDAHMDNRKYFNRPAAASGPLKAKIQEYMKDKDN